MRDFGESLTVLGRFEDNKEDGDSIIIIEWTDLSAEGFENNTLYNIPRSIRSLMILQITVDFFFLKGRALKFGRRARQESRSALSVKTKN